jgi:uncharacterized membrane protein required for colicin V production
MNGLDYAIIVIIALGALYGMNRGVLRMATSILSLVLGIYAASLWYPRAAALAHHYLGTSPAVSSAIGYVAIFVMVFVAVEYAGARIVQLAHIIHLNWIDQLGGAVFGAAIAAVFAGLDVLLLTAVLPAHAPLLRNSEFAPRVLAYNQMLLAYVPPEVKRLYQTKHAELVRDWHDKIENPAPSP